jgi:hypothetical protein
MPIDQDRQLTRISPHPPYSLRLRRWKVHVPPKRRKHCPHPQDAIFQEQDHNHHNTLILKEITAIFWSYRK